MEILSKDVEQECGEIVHHIYNKNLKIRLMGYENHLHLHNEEIVKETCPYCERVKNKIHT